MLDDVVAKLRCGREGPLAAVEGTVHWWVRSHHTAEMPVLPALRLGVMGGQMASARMDDGDGVGGGSLPRMTQHPPRVEHPPGLEAAGETRRRRPGMNAVKGRGGDAATKKNVSIVVHKEDRLVVGLVVGVDYVRRSRRI